MLAVLIVSTSGHTQPLPILQAGKLVRIELSTYTSSGSLNSNRYWVEGDKSYFAYGRLQAAEGQPLTLEPPFPSANYYKLCGGVPKQCLQLAD